MILKSRLTANLPPLFTIRNLPKQMLIAASYCELHLRKKQMPFRIMWVCLNPTSEKPGKFDKNGSELLLLATKLMHLRDHPQMRQQGRVAWPPIWNKTKDTAPTVAGELGVLKYVHSRAGVSLKCYIVMEYGNEQYVGEIVANDKAFYQRIMVLLQTNIGRSIKEIGDIEIA